MYIYEVRPGDSLTRIARQHRVTVNQIVVINRLPLPALVPGQALLIPSNQYPVQRGDTLWSIARKSGATLPQLRAANPGVGDVLQPDQIINVPPPDPYPAEMIGYLPVLDPGVDVADLRAWGRVLTYVAVFTYQVDARGDLSSIDDVPVIAAARELGVRPLMSIANMGPGGRFSPDIARTMLTDPRVRDRVFDAVQRIVTAKGYAGVDSDIENIPRELREEYVEFLRLLKDRIDGRLLNAAVSPQYDTVYEYGRGHDYAGIGRVVDRMYIMNYEFHWPGGPPGAIAPLPQVRQVLEYAAARSPREKLLNGMPIAAYDWPVPDRPDTVARGLEYETALRLALEQQVPIRYDETARAPSFRYRREGQAHEVWFEDARSLMAKLLLVRDLGLRGTGVWHLGMRHGQLQRLLPYVFNIAKGSGA